MIGLEAGADDYIAKPFVVEELVARVKAHLRREERHNEKAEEGVIKVGDIELHTGSFEVYKHGEIVYFSTREFQLLQYLMENAGKVLTREQIFGHVWDTEFGDIGTVAVNIKSIRDKIDPNNEYTVPYMWGTMGFMYDPEKIPTEVVSSYLGLSLAWFHAKAVKGNGIPFRKIGHRRMYQKNEVIFWINTHCPKILRAEQY